MRRSAHTVDLTTDIDPRPPFIAVNDVSKRFEAARRPRDSVQALDGISFGAQKGEMVALLGPSGSGKTTLLRCIAGLERIDAGSIRLGANVVAAPPRIHQSARDRGLGMIFQSYALWPHLTVLENVAYPLRIRGLHGSVLTGKVREYLRLVDCGELAERFPHELSGGQQQRVALARALVYEPNVVLFDEPLSNLDTGLREELRYQIRQIQKLVGFTGIYVTHEQAEAFYLGDRIAILGGGRLLQFGTPAQVFDDPASATVARFLGCTNWLRGKLIRVADGWYVAVAQEQKLLLDTPLPWFREGCDVLAACRPDDLDIRPVALVPLEGGLRGVVEDKLDLGHHTEYSVRVGPDIAWRCRADRRRVEPLASDVVSIAPREHRLRLFPVADEAAPS